MARRRIPDSRQRPFLLRHPQAGYWLERGLHPKAARELVKAGIRSVEDLGRMAREDLAILPGVGERSLAQLERLRGGPLTSPAGFWLERGLRPRVAQALIRAGVDSIEALGRMTREQLLSLTGVAEGSLQAVEAVLGRPLDSPVREWRRRGLRAIAAHRLARAGIRTVPELAEQLTGPALQRIGLWPLDVAICRSLVREHRKRRS
jgi:predicted RecB family nuclease